MLSMRKTVEHGLQSRIQRALACLTLPLAIMGNALASDLPAAPGRLIDVGGFNLHIQCNGAGQPTVLLEAGLGGVSLEWANIQAELAHTQRVCSYDRAGMGWSDAGPMPRTSGEVVTELHELLNKAGEQGPFVLVGHSIGGYSAQLFAARYPALSAGLVLIDSSHPEQIERFAAPPTSVNLAPRGRLMQLMPVRVPEHMPEQVRASAAALAVALKARQAVTSELESYRASAAEVQAGVVPNIPLIVLTRGQQQWPHDERGDRMEALWRTLQAELARKTDMAGQVVAARSSHYIHLDQPELVCAAIRIVATAARQAGGINAQRVAMQQGLQDLASQFTQIASVSAPALLPQLLAMNH